MRVFSVRESSSKSGAPVERVEDDVLHHRAEMFAGGVDFRLHLARQADRLGVAAAFEVEHAFAAPAVLVVADQRSAGDGRQRRLAGARQAEKDRDVVRLAEIGRAMHRQHVDVGQDEVEIGEHRLLHLAGVTGAADQHDATGEVAGDHRLGTAAVAARVGAERRQVDDRQIRHEVGERAALRPDQQVADEQRVPGEFGEDAGAHARFRVGAGVEVLDEQLAAFGVGDEVGEQHVEVLARHRVVAFPPDRVLGRRVADDRLVFRAAPRVDAGLGDQRAALGDHRFVAADRLGVKLRRLMVPVKRRRDRGNRTPLRRIRR